jgi:hypothetical protein
LPINPSSQMWVFLAWQNLGIMGSYMKIEQIFSIVGILTILQ